MKRLTNTRWINFILPALLISGLGCASILSGDAAGDNSMDAVARKVQAVYNNLDGFRANFTQTLLNASSEMPLKESGKMMIRKGGFMRWDYSQPEEKHFICDGIKCYMYIPEEEIAQVFPLRNMDAKSVPLLFFAGKGDLIRDFNLHGIPVATQTEKDKKIVKLRMTPKGDSESFEYIIVHIDVKTYFIVRMRVVDLLGNETDYLFESIRRDASIPKSNFVFIPPEGVEIIKIEE